MRSTATPLDPSWITQHALRLGHARCFEEDDQIVIGIGRAESFVVAVRVHGDAPPAGRRRAVHNDRSTPHASSLLRFPRPGQPAATAGATRLRQANRT